VPTPVPDVVLGESTGAGSSPNSSTGVRKLNPTAQTMNKMIHGILDFNVRCGFRRVGDLLVAEVLLLAVVRVLVLPRAVVLLRVAISPSPNYKAETPQIREI